MDTTASSVVQRRLWSFCLSHDTSRFSIQLYFASFISARYVFRELIVNCQGTSYDEMLATVFSLVNEYRESVWLLFKADSSMMMPDEWNNARLPEKGVNDWVEVSARPANTTQLFACSLVKVLFRYLSNGKSLLEFDRYLRQSLHCQSLAYRRNQRLNFVYAGHAIRKDKYRGIGVYHGKPVLAIETDTKYLYGRTLTPNQEMEYANASHIFADMLAMSQRPSEIKDEATHSNTSQERTSKVVFSQPLTKEVCMRLWVFC